MNIDAQTWMIVGVLFVSTFIRAAFGFGDALLAMPLLALLLHLKVATPVVAMIATTIALCLIVRHWRMIRFRSVWRLILSSICGIPVGLFFLKGAYDEPMKIVLALVIFLFSFYSIFKTRPFRLRSERFSFLFGFVAGILGGAYNTNGPPVVIYGTLRQWAPNAFRATLQGYFLLSGGCIAASHLVSGLWTKEVLTLYGTSLPFVLLAVFLGDRLGGSIPKGKFDRSIHCLLMGAGLLLLFQTLGAF